MRKALLGASALQGRRLVVAFLIVMGLANVAQAQFPDYFNVKEVGPSPGSTIELEFDFGLSSDIDKLTSPSGEIFTPQPGPGPQRFPQLLKTFSSLDDAFNYLAGDWQGTYTPNPITGTPVTFDFQINSVPIASVNRGGLENLSLQPGDQIRSGKTFLMSWDLTGGQASGAYLNIVPQFASGSGQSTHFFSRPNPNGNTHSGGSMGSINSFFETDYRNQPGTNEFRFLTTYTAAPLPLDLAMTFGTSTALNDFVENLGDGDSNPFNGPPLIGLRYLRMADPFEVTVVSVPEPATCTLLSIAMLTILHTVGTRRELRKALAREDFIAESWKPPL